MSFKSGESLPIQTHEPEGNYPFAATSVEYGNDNGSGKIQNGEAPDSQAESRKTKLLNRLAENIEQHRELPYTAGIADQPEDEEAVRRLHADTYLQRGYITPEDVDENGFLTREKDPYHDSSLYFWVKNKETGSEEAPIAGGRQIISANGNTDGFQFFEKTGITPEDMSVFSEIHPEEIVEISGLAKQRGENPTAMMFLYREMLHYSISKGHKLWLITAQAEFFDKAKLMFGENVETAGPEIDVPYLNTTAVPAVLYPQESLTILEKQADNADVGTQRYAEAVFNFFASESR